MAIKPVSDYQVLADGSVELGRGADRSVRFEWQNPGNFFGVSALQHFAFFSFNLRAVQDGRLSITAIGSGPTEILDRVRFNKSSTRVYQEAFNLASILGQTEQSLGVHMDMRFEFEVEDGPIILSDIILHYKVGVEV